MWVASIGEHLLNIDGNFDAARRFRSNFQRGIRVAEYNLPLVEHLLLFIAMERGQRRITGILPITPETSFVILACQMFRSDDSNIVA